MQGLGDTGISAGDVMWRPAPDAHETTRLGGYMSWLEQNGAAFEDYAALWRWSVSSLEDFWLSIWRYFDVVGEGDPEPALVSREMPGARWFPRVRLNWAENALRHEMSDDPIIVARSQSRPEVRMTRAGLRSEVARVRDGLRRLGVGPGDRVAGYLPNIPEAAIGLLATASLGAIWASCPPEFGTQSVLDRFSQIEPKVLIAVDGYRYGEKSIDRTTEIAEIRAGLPSLDMTVALPYLSDEADRLPDTLGWEELRRNESALEFERVPFDHPLWILFSSGTTGLPKAIVHGHGGIVLEHLKMGALMQDLGPRRRYFFFSTTAWMVWNRVVSSLLTGAGFVILDGDPTHPSLDSLFALVAETGVTDWGVSATYLMLCRDAGHVPVRDHDLSRLRTIVSAGSPVPLDGYRYIRESVKPDVQFYSGSGGTDVCSGFVSGTPLTPVTAGEIPARMLGVKAEAYSERGESLIDEPGELVITEPMPSMPVCFWNDPSGERYRGTYFERYPGKWRHGDRFVVTSRGTCNIIGRSDATLNRGGVRLGTGEFYPVVEAVEGIADSLVVHLDDEFGGRGELLLFVVLEPEAELDDDLLRHLGSELRRQRSPRHVPDRVHAVPAIPRTLTGKKLEVPVKQIMLGAEPDSVASRGSLQDPTALDAFADLATRRQPTSGGRKE